MPLRKLRCGIAGFGFIGPHHADAIRRLGFVDIVAICTADAATDGPKADRLGIGRIYERFDDLANDPEIDVIDIAAPTCLHCEFALKAIQAGKHVIVDKPMAMSSTDAGRMLQAAQAAGVVNAVTFNYRYFPLVQQLRAAIAAGKPGRVHLVHGHYLQEWLTRETDYNWRLEPERAGEGAILGDLACHWFDLAEYVTGLRIESVLADLTTTLPRRKVGSAEIEVRVPDQATVLLRFDNGARGAFFTSSLCPGHKNDLRIEVNGLDMSFAWRQEAPNVLWVGRRDEPDGLLSRDPALLDEPVRRYAATPGGHNEGWPDAFRNIMREIFEHIACGRPPTAATFPTFADGLRAARLVEAMLASHKAAAWTAVNLPVSNSS